jgi:hypothetical protein
MRQIAKGHVAEVAGQPWGVVDQPFGRLKRIAHQNDLANRFGRKAAPAAAVEAEAIAGKAEFGYVAAAVRQQFTIPDGTGETLYQLSEVSPSA